MTVVRDDVIAAYRMILDRDPESDVAIEALLNVADWHELRNRLLLSQEYLARNPMSQRTAGDRLFDGLNEGDEDLMRRHLNPGESEAGYVKNFVGTRMRSRFIDVLAGMSGAVFANIPTVVGDYHAEAIEYVGTLKAIEAGHGAFVAVELGAGWGSWSVTAGHVARRCGRSPIRLYAVEASAGKVENMRTHYRDNGLDPSEHRLVTAVLGPTDGYALFPLVDVTGDWGGEAIFVETDGEMPQRDGYEVLPSISLKTLLKDEDVVDLIHFDIQGAEREAISASIDTLNEKVRYVVIGTHGRDIEGTLMTLLSANGWRFENEQPARIAPAADGSITLLADGTQVWRNPRKS
jgi:FkbM family methyltransferase